MTNSELLMLDLCCRLPYNTTVKLTSLNEGNGYSYDLPLTEKIFSFMGQYDIKPYLVPMYDMTDEQQIEASKILDARGYEISEFGDIQSSKLVYDDIAYINIENIAAYIDWLNRNDFDYRGLIKMGLAVNKKTLKQE